MPARLMPCAGIGDDLVWMYRFWRNASTELQEPRLNQFWRPVTAIQMAGTDGNPNTNPDPDWLPLSIKTAGPGLCPRLEEGGAHDRLRT